MASVQKFLNMNEAYALTFQKGSLHEPSTGKLAVLMCVDGYIDLLVLSHLEGHARFIPKVGDRTADALHALISSDALLDTTAIMVIHHTACDMLPSRNEERPAELKQEPSAGVSNVGSLHFSDLERSVRENVALLRASPLIPKSTEITGLIYDVSSRNLFPVTYSLV